MMTDNEFIVKHGFEKAWLDKFLQESDGCWVKQVNETPYVEIELFRLTGADDSKRWEAWLEDFYGTGPTAEAAVSEVVEKALAVAGMLRREFENDQR
jgi:hypothetical protein